MQKESPLPTLAKLNKLLKKNGYVITFSKEDEQEGYYSDFLAVHPGTVISYGVEQKDEGVLLRGVVQSDMFTDRCGADQEILSVMERLLNAKLRGLFTVLVSCEHGCLEILRTVNQRDSLEKPFALITSYIESIGELVGRSLVEGFSAQKVLECLVAVSNSFGDEYDFSSFIALSWSALEKGVAGSLSFEQLGQMTETAAVLNEADKAIGNAHEIEPLECTAKTRSTLKKTLPKMVDRWRNTPLHGSRVCWCAPTTDKQFAELEEKLADKEDQECLILFRFARGVLHTYSYVIATTFDIEENGQLEVVALKEQRNGKVELLQEKQAVEHMETLLQEVMQDREYEERMRRIGNIARRYHGWPDWPYASSEDVPDASVFAIRELEQLLRAREVEDDGSTIVVACSSYLDAPFLQKVFGDRLLYVLFDDVTNEQRPTAISRAQAQDIAAFVKEHEEGASRFFFCCDGGVSRSAALCAATFSRWGKNELLIFADGTKKPNELVFHRLCEAYGLKNSENYIESLFKENEKARRLKVLELGHCFG